MYNPSHKDTACLLNISDAIDKIKRYSESFLDADDLYKDSKSFDAVLMNFVVIGEMAEKLSDDFKDSTDTQINWLKTRSLRHIIAHNYFGVDAEEVWQIIEDSLLDLGETLKDILEE
jgi:uncharacterized protein with HEPN domain